MLKSPIKFVSGNEHRIALTDTADNRNAMPTMSTGGKPKYLAVCHDGDSGAGLTVNVLCSATTAGAVGIITKGTGFMVPQHEVVIFNVTGESYYSVIASAAGPVDITLVPLENF